MKKVLIIVGSSRNGSSIFIGGFTNDYLSKSNHSVELIQLSNYKIDYCDGCLACDETGICHKKDDVNFLLDKVKEADGVVFISPTRWSLLSGDMKVFMDRWNPLAGRNIFDNKKSLIVTVGQTNLKESGSIAKALESLRFFSDDAGFQLCGEFSFEDCLACDDIKWKTDQFARFSSVLKTYTEKI